ncbi:hypothetical protein [Paenibacillus sp. Soil787]|uniref:hypothetical protein n=1 Tax=Paenibacillus sp. Soil787 TaxID=1736411 RepID=UPI0012E3BC80|nr:hypothetical protein [Paenibacillus sp. Soil787]
MISGKGWVTERFPFITGDIRDEYPRCMWLVTMSYSVADVSDVAVARWNDEFHRSRLQFVRQ